MKISSRFNIRTSLAGIFVCSAGLSFLLAAEVQLKNGMILTGNLGKIAGLAENPLSAKAADKTGAQLIVLVDDGLRRTFVSTYQVQAVAESDAHGLERILIRQRVAHAGRRIGAVGPIVAVEPFDEWGRRTFSMNSAEGRLDILQGITEITPVWTRVQGLMCQKPFVWDTRIATSSIPRKTLAKILLKQIDAEDPDQRLKLVRLHIQAERYKEARLELEDILAAFPELEELERQVVTLRQMSARELIKEIELRRDAGQHFLVMNMLSNFPSDDVAGETLQQVREMLAWYETETAHGKKVQRLIEENLQRVTDVRNREKLNVVCEEIIDDLNVNTIPRLAPFERLADDENLAAEQKLSLAISGWLLGGSAADQNLAVSLSLAEVRDLVRRYLTTDRPAERRDILEQLSGLEGSSPGRVARLLLNMKPPVETPKAEGATPGFHELSTPGISGEPDVRYLVQLPPRYDPYRRYPTIITLNGSGTTPSQQIDWWAGAYNEAAKMRLGQATRHGYVVIAPIWSKKHQYRYEYSAQEHAAVLFSLRDACRRFSIDTDRVFLSGHSMGGDAAWDIAISHPDLWAGAMPIVATADKYIARYWENAKAVPLYFVGGELDGNRMATNARDLDRYLKRTGYDTIVVEFLGRGHEHFIDEVQRLFQWMSLHKRNFFPKAFNAVSMRDWDNFFWWIEVDDIPGRSTVLPFRWPPPSGAQPVKIEGKLQPGNRVNLRTGAGRATIYLSPEMVDFEQRIEVSVNGRLHREAVRQEIEVLLEDARTRGDRLHPFHAKIELDTGRGGR